MLIQLLAGTKRGQIGDTQSVPDTVGAVEVAAGRALDLFSVNTDGSVKLNGATFADSSKQTSAPSVIQGAKGDKGDTGSAGAAGAAGATGPAGPAGPAPTNSGNKVLATPADGSSGAAAARNLVPADLPASVSPVTTFPAAVTSLNAYGDSITSGYGLTYATQAWVALFAQAIGLPLSNNFAVTGHAIYQQGFIGAAYQQSPSAAVGSLALIGANDISSDTTQLMRAYMAFLAWLGLPNSQKATVASGITFSGSWTTFAEFNLNGKYSNTLNNTATATVNGTTVYVAGWVTNTYTNTFDILIDGVSQGPYSIAGFAAANPYCIRFSGLSAGAHTVVVKVTSGGGYAVVQWIGGNGAGSGLPFVGVGNTIHRTELDPTAHNAALVTLVGQLVSDGLSVALVNDNAAVALSQTPPQYQADLVHPNVLGATLIAEKWAETFYSALSFPAVTGKNGDALAQVLAASGITPHRLTAFINALLLGDLK